MAFERVDIPRDKERFRRHRRRFSAVRQVSDRRSQLSDSVAVAESYAYTSQHTPNVRQPFMFHYSNCLADRVAAVTTGDQMQLWNDVFCCFYRLFCCLKSSGARDVLFSDVFCILYGSFCRPALLKASCRIAFDPSFRQLPRQWRPA